MKNLLEELDRIKDLMVYKKGTPINEVSTSRSGAPTKVVKTSVNKAQSAAPKSKDVSTTIMKALKKEENCVLVTHTENFNVNISIGEGAKKFHNKFINVLKEKFGNDLTGGHLTLSNIKVFGGASNYNKGKVKPEYCNEYDETKGTQSLKKWSSGCEGFGKIEYKGNSAGTTRNTKLAENRAKNVLKEIKTNIINSAKEANIKLPEGFNESEIKFVSGTVYTGNKIDENKPSNLKNGQIVMVDAKLCFVKDPDPDPEDCPDKCMEKDKEGKCKCKAGLKEVDDPENEGQKKCVCEKTNEPPNDDCKCDDKKKEECPDPCMKKNEDGKCECPSDMKYDEEKKECVCKDDGKIKVPSGCKCEKKKTISCNYNKEIVGKRGSKENNYVSKSIKTTFPANAKNSLTIEFDSVDVPDAYYIKYGDKEEFSYFRGLKYKSGQQMAAYSDTSDGGKGIQDYKFMYNILPKNVRKIIEKQGKTDKAIMRTMRGLMRNYIGELINYKNKGDLIGSINNAIKQAGGKLVVNSLIEGGDGQAEKITKQIANGRVKYKKGLDSYREINKKFVETFNFDKENEETELIVLVFSPLSKTIFNMKVTCK